MREFVMGDVHGAFKALKQCLKMVKFDYRKDRLIQLGDVTDRYGQVYECVEELLKIDNLVQLRGNHDDWFDEFCQTGYHPAGWVHGGLATARSYLNYISGKKPVVSDEYELIQLLNPKDIPERHKDFFANMQPYYIDGDGRCFVHGGFDRFVPFTDQFLSTYYWDRELWAAALEWQVRERQTPGQSPLVTKTHFKEIFLGHTPTTHWNITVPMRGFNVYNLDTGVGQGGRLTIMEVVTKKYCQSDPVAELYKAFRASVGG